MWQPQRNKMLKPSLGLKKKTLANHTKTRCKTLGDGDRWTTTPYTTPLNWNTYILLHLPYKFKPFMMGHIGRYSKKHLEDHPIYRQFFAPIQNAMNGHHEEFNHHLHPSILGWCFLPRITFAGPCWIKWVGRDAALFVLVVGSVKGKVPAFGNMCVFFFLGGGGWGGVWLWVAERKKQKGGSK